MRSPYRNVTTWFETLPMGEVRDVVEPLLHVAYLMFVMEAAIQTGNIEIVTSTREKMKKDINEFFGWEAKS